MPKFTSSLTEHVPQKSLVVLSHFSEDSKADLQKIETLRNSLGDRLFQKLHYLDNMNFREALSL